MTKSYYYGRVEKKQTKPATNKQIESSSEIDSYESEYNQFINKINQDKLDEVYLKGLEIINNTQADIIEKVMRKHKSLMQKETNNEIGGVDNEKPRKQGD